MGRQLRHVDEQDGRCKRASLRFIAALRECGQDGSILEWTGGGREPGEAGWFHDVVLLDGSEIIVDWTGAQFEEDERARRLVPYPRVEARATAEERWGRPREYSPESRFFPELPNRLPPWSSAQQRIPERGSSEERLNRF